MIESAIRDLIRAGPSGQVLVLLLLLTALSPLLLILVRRRFQARGHLVLWAYSSAIAALLMATAAFHYRAQKTVLADLVELGLDPSNMSYSIARYLDASMNRQSVAGLSVLIAVPVLLTVVGIRRLRETRKSARKRPGIMAVLGIAAVHLWFAALGLFLHARQSLQSLSWCSDPACRYGEWIDAFHGLASARAGVLAAAILASVAVPVIVWFRPLEIRSNLARVVGLMALACAFGLVCLVRPFAEDAANPLAFTDEPLLAAGLELPEAARCDRFTGGPEVTEAGWGVLVDGAPAGNSAEFNTVLEAKRAVWAQLRPREAMPAVIHLLLASHYPASEARRIIRTMRGAGFSDVRIGVAAPAHAVHTRTAGTVAYQRRWCSVRLPRGIDWRSMVNWGDVAALAAQR